MAKYLPNPYSVSRFHPLRKGKLPMKTDSNSYTRRDFGRLVGLTVGGVLVAPFVHGKSRVPIALELYSIRKECAEDLAGSLSRVAEMGYDGVEFAGYHGHSAEAVRKMLEDTGLKAYSVHTGWPTVQPDQLMETIEFNKAVGNKNLVVPGMPGQVREATAEYLDVARRFTEICAKAGEHGMRIGYHNHTWEFEGEPGKRFWDVLADNTPDELFLQLDVGHCRRAGQDPVAYINKYPGRSLSIHVKDYSPDSEEILLGEGIVDLKGVFSAAETVGGIDTYIIEQETYPYPPMESVKRCLENMKKIMA